MSAGKISMVIAMVALLASVAYFYQKMDAGRSSKGAGGESKSKQDLAVGVALQGQINELKDMLKKLAQENAAMKKSVAELRLRKEELKVCNANLEKIRKDKGKVETWATNVDDAMAKKSQKLTETKGKLASERVKSSELAQRVEAMQTKLSQTKSALKDIEMQKEESVNQFREQKTKYSQLNDELKKLKSKNEDKGRQAEIEKLISEMNKDLRQKSSVIQELTKQKRASDDMLRRLEGTLIKAGVDPSDIERATQPKDTTSKSPTPVNPAAAAMMQVGTGTDNPATTALGKAEILFGQVDDNGDKTIDVIEFKRHIKPQLRAQHAGAAFESFVSRKFAEIDKDRTGFIKKEEALRMPEALISVLSAEVPLEALKTNPEDGLVSRGAASATGNATAAPAPTGVFGNLLGSLSNFGGVFGGSPSKPNASWKGPPPKEEPDSQKGGGDPKQEGPKASEGSKDSKGSKGSESKLRGEGNQFAKASEGSTDSKGSKSSEGGKGSESKLRGEGKQFAKASEGKQGGEGKGGKGSEGKQREEGKLSKGSEGKQDEKDAASRLGKKGGVRDDADGDR
jgi:hypothetical protein